VGLALVFSACTDLGLPDGGIVSTADLVILPLQSTAPAPATGSFVVLNDRTVVRQILHQDAFNTPFLELRFPGGSIVQAGGTPIGPSDSVTVVAQPASGRYGFTLSPDNLEFNAGTLPSVRFFYGQYGDLSVSSGAFDTVGDYADALALWYEVTPGRWERVAGSGPDGIDAVLGSLAQPGTYMVAAVP
jgi:hypothetical protein